MLDRLQSILNQPAAFEQEWTEGSDAVGHSGISARGAMAALRSDCSTKDLIIFTIQVYSVFPCETPFEIEGFVALILFRADVMSLRFVFRPARRETISFDFIIMSRVRPLLSVRRDNLHLFASPTSGSIPSLIAFIVLGSAEN